MHVRITKPDGTVIDVDGTPQECAALLDTITVTPAQTTPVLTPFIVPLPYVYPTSPLPYPYYTWGNTGTVGVISVSETTLPQD
jgi:hypothetical protein